MDEIANDNEVAPNMEKLNVAQLVALREELHMLLVACEKTLEKRQQEINELIAADKKWSVTVF